MLTNKSRPRITFFSDCSTFLRLGKGGFASCASFKSISVNFTHISICWTELLDGQIFGIDFSRYEILILPVQIKNIFEKMIEDSSFQARDITEAGGKTRALEEYGARYFPHEVRDLGACCGAHARSRASHDMACCLSFNIRNIPDKHQKPYHLMVCTEIWSLRSWDIKNWLKVNKNTLALVSMVK